jgi:hypothetical protein
LLGQAEVGDIDVFVLGDQNVARLDIAVDKPAPVRGVETGRGLSHDRDCPRGSEWAVAAEEFAQIRPLDPAHRDVKHAVCFVGVVDRDDVRVIERGGQLRFAQEALAEALIVGKLRREQLERDLPVQAQMLCEIDAGHATPAEQPLDPVAGDHRADTGIDHAHGLLTQT